VNMAHERGLRWLGESELEKNHPQMLDDATDGLAYHHAVDEMTGRTFRSAMFCRADHTIQPLADMEAFEYFVRKIPASVTGDDDILRFLNACSGSAISMAELADGVGMAMPELAKRVHRGAVEGCLELRSEATKLSAEMPAKPCLNAWRMACASRGLPIVDAWLHSCSFPPGHFELLARMDGSRTVSQLEVESRARCPELDFQRWMAHLNGRGFFS